TRQAVDDEKSTLVVSEIDAVVSTRCNAHGIVVVDELVLVLLKVRTIVRFRLQILFDPLAHNSLTPRVRDQVERSGNAVHQVRHQRGASRLLQRTLWEDEEATPHAPLIIRFERVKAMHFRSPGEALQISTCAEGRGHVNTLLCPVEGRVCPGRRNEWPDQNASGSHVEMARIEMVLDLNPPILEIVRITV